jgi:hypothetical protein
VAAGSTIHGFLEIQPNARVLRLTPSDGLAIVHFNYVDVHQFLEKLNRYTDIEAALHYRSPKAGSILRAANRATREFLDRYLRFQGYKDGWRGFYLSALMAMYKLVVAAKVRERQANGDRDAIEATYAAVAEQVLTAYGPEFRRRGED